MQFDGQGGPAGFGKGTAKVRLEPADEQRNLHLFALNFCILKINQVQPAYYREALDLYQSALNADLLLENGQL